jgi:hypothetical protein
MKRLLCALTVGLVVAAGAVAAPQVDTDPTKDYTIRPEAGAWVIYVQSYTNSRDPNAPKAMDLAREMCLEIRSRYNLPAWIFNRGAEERKKQEEYVRKVRELTDKTPGARIRVHHIDEQCAVLVGGYKDMDDARSALDNIKRLKPPEKKHLLDVVTITGQAKSEDGKAPPREAGTGQYVNPFVNSFVARNPTVPLEKPAQDPGKADKLLRELNTGRPYNLLSNRHPWTLAVKEFQGASVIQSKSTSSSSFLDMLGFGKKSGELLNAGALQAEEIARVLRELKFDAYVLHTRFSSVVTVGGFENKEDPQMVQLSKKLGGAKFGPVELFVRPLPMPVPH